MKSLIVIASLITLASCNGGGSGSSNGSALTQGQLNQTITNITALRNKVGFQYSSDDESSTCNGKEARAITTNTVISSSDNAVVARIEKSGTACNDSGDVVDITESSIEISKKEIPSAEEMGNVKTSVKGNLLTLESTDNSQDASVTIIDLSTGCVIDSHLKSDPDQKFSETCENVDVKKINISDDLVYLRTKEGPNKNFNKKKLINLTGRDIEDKVIIIKNLPELSAANEINYQDYITIK